MLTIGPSVASLAAVAITHWVGGGALLVTPSRGRQALVDGGVDACAQAVGVEPGQRWYRLPGSSATMAAASVPTT